MTARARALNGVCISLNCLTAGAIATFPLFSPPLARGLLLSPVQTSALASASIAGQYGSAFMWGVLCDRRGPGAVSLAAAALFAGGFGMMGWMASRGTPLLEGQWVWLSAFYFLAGCGTSASYFSAIIAATKSFPARHSGLAIGIPCSIFGLSPLFLSALATYFTSNAAPPSIGAGELDPGKWLAFLAVFLASVNTLGAVGLKVIPPEEEEEELDDERDEVDSGCVPDLVDERTPLFAKRSHSVASLFSNPTFWLFGVVILCSIGPCEMAMASLGGQIESLLRVHASDESTPPSYALALRRHHVQIISIANTLTRLAVGALSDWLSFAAIATVATVPSTGILSHLPRPPRVSRLLFLLVASVLLTVAFAYVAFGLDHPDGLWVLSVSVGMGYGTIFTMAPSIVRSVYPVADFGRNWGLISWFSAIGALIFTPLFGYLSAPACYGRECWEGVYALSSTSTGLAAILILVLWRGWWSGKV